MAGETLDSLVSEFHRSRMTIKQVVTAAGGKIRSRGVPKGYTWTDSAREQHRLACNEPEFRERSRAVINRLNAMGKMGKRPRLRCVN